MPRAPYPRSSLAASSPHGAAAAEEPLAAAVAASILSEGGSAVDAAVAAAFTLTVTLPHLGGIGGDFFALVLEPGGHVWGVNGSGPSPAGLSLEATGGKVPERGPLSVTVPGLVDGLRLLWSRGGRLEWRRLVAPAMILAERGFPTASSLSAALRRHRGDLASLGGSSYFPGGRVPEPGEPLRLPGLAKLLSIVAEDPRQFYEGAPAEAIAAILRRLGGVMEPEDMEEYRAEIIEPLAGTYRGWRIYEVPPNSQGATTLLMLAALERLGPLAPDPAERLDRLLAAALPSYRLRDRFLGDPRYMEMSPGWLERLIEEAALEAEKLRPSPGPSPGAVPGPGGDTTAFTVIDGEGRIVVGIQSLYYPFGSLVTEPRYQVTLNNRAACFTAEPGLPNTLGPRKKPLHTLSAMLLQRPGGGWIGVALSGGHYRPQLHAVIASYIVDAGMDPADAVAARRAAWEPGSDIVNVEPGSSPEPPGGYRLRTRRLGVAAAAEARPGRLPRAAADPRGEGAAVPASPR